MDLVIHTDLSIANIDEMKEIYHSVGWERHTNEVISTIGRDSGTSSKRVIHIIHD